MLRILLKILSDGSFNSVLTLCNGPNRFFLFWCNSIFLKSPVDCAIFLSITAVLIFWDYFLSLVLSWIELTEVSYKLCLLFFLHCLTWVASISFGLYSYILSHLLASASFDRSSLLVEIVCVYFKPSLILLVFRVIDLNILLFMSYETSSLSWLLNNLLVDFK